MSPCRLRRLHQRYSMQRCNGPTRHKTQTQYLFTCKSTRRSSTILRYKYEIINLFFHLVVRSHGVVAAIRTLLRIDVFLRRPRQLGVHVRLAVGVPLVFRLAGRSGPAAGRTVPFQTTALIPVVTACALNRTALTPRKSSTIATTATLAGRGVGGGVWITDQLPINYRLITDCRYH